MTKSSKAALVDWRNYWRALPKDVRLKWLNGMCPPTGLSPGEENFREVGLVLLESLGNEEPCGHCGGGGFRGDAIPCPRCKGAGWESRDD